MDRKYRSGLFLPFEWGTLRGESSRDREGNTGNDETQNGSKRERKSNWGETRVHTYALTYKQTVQFDNRWSYRWLKHSTGGVANSRPPFFSTDSFTEKIHTLNNFKTKKKSKTHALH